MEVDDFDAYVDELRRRLFDHETQHDATIPNFDELMSDVDAPDTYPVQAYEELLDLGHLNPTLSGMTGGPKVHGLLSAEGRRYVRRGPHG